jgi:mannose-6-phosphate isomerase-like protein (cupin superfamily)
VAGHDHLTSPNLRGHERFTTEPKKVDKPWGYELIFAVTERYAGKLLHVKAGESLSLQFHNVKDEAWYVLEGRAEVELGAPGESVLAKEVVGAGAAFRFTPGTVHRVKALEDTTILEVSTPELDDVVRLEDNYGRTGTSEP